MKLRTTASVGATACAAFLALTSPALAVSINRAERAVERQAEKRYGVRYADVSCRSLNARRASCTWSGLSDADVMHGNPSGWRGTARVVRYRDGLDVRMTVLNPGY